MKFEAGKKEIRGCRACDQCWSKGEPCVFKDDFSELVPLLEEADILVFVTPLYYYNMSAQLKAAVDRFYAYDSASCKRPLKLKEGILLACAGGSGGFDGLVSTYHHINNFLHLKNAGVLTVSNVDTKEDLIKTNALKDAELIGKNL